MSLAWKHQGGDGVELDAEDVQSKVQAIQHELRFFSSYKIAGRKMWVITEADRSSTCLLLPDEY